MHKSLKSGVKWKLRKNGMMVGEEGKRYVRKQGM